MQVHSCWQPRCSARSLRCSHRKPCVQTLLENARTFTPPHTCIPHRCIHMTCTHANVCMQKDTYACIHIITSMHSTKIHTYDMNACKLMHAYRYVRMHSHHTDAFHEDACIGRGCMQIDVCACIHWSYGHSQEELEEHITEARSEYLEYATQQMLNANAPNQPIAWHGDPTVGVPLSAGDRHNLHVSTMGSGAHAGTLRLYQGRVIQVMQNPPIFRLPNKGAIKRLHSRGTGRKAVIRAESRLETLKRQQHIRNTADLHHSSVNDGRLTARTRKGRLRTAAHGVPPPISPEYSPERDQETGHSNMHTAERMCVDPTDTDSNNTDK
eukprot:m.29686 g.29686  ORF g.29686 m.29686 type:complete len:325 (-) comp13760_c0_seq4:95-1069(-)